MRREEEEKVIFNANDPFPIFAYICEFVGNHCEGFINGCGYARNCHNPVNKNIILKKHIMLKTSPGTIHRIY
jgi:hypothetical protein